MTDSLSALRETLERTLRELDYDRIVDISDLLADLMPVISAALAEKDRFITTLEVEMDLPRDVNALIERAERAEAQLAEKDAQIAALQHELAGLRTIAPSIRESFVNDTLADEPDELADNELCDCEDCISLRLDVLRRIYRRLRETPAPPQAQEPK